MGEGRGMWLPTSQIFAHLHPWITLGLQKSISVINKLLTNYINKRDPVLKEEFHTKCKIHRNLLSTLMKKSKQDYYDKYFERNCNNIKNTWKGIKSLISLKFVASRAPTVLSLNNGDIYYNQSLWYCKYL